MWPGVGVLCPRVEAVPWSEVFGCVKDGEDCCEHGKNDETACEIDAAKEYLRYSYSYFDFLFTVSAPSLRRKLQDTYQVFSLLLLCFLLLLL